MSLDTLSEYLYYVMIDKAEGEALTRVRAARPGEGVKAYFTLHKWFTETTGLGISEQMKGVMTPAPPKTEGEIADCIDKWLETMRQLEDMKDEYKLSDPFNITALNVMTVGRGK